MKLSDVPRLQAALRGLPPTPTEANFLGTQDVGELSHLTPSGRRRPGRVLIGEERDQAINTFMAWLERGCPDDERDFGGSPIDTWERTQMRGRLCGT